jgi:endonuclease G, mitochondrial
MKKLLLLFLMATPVQAQLLEIDREEYDIVFSTELMYPLSVKWETNREDVTCEDPLSRKDRFVPDPLYREETNLAKDYVGSGLDRGHISPAADNLCDGEAVMLESFYFTNMAPQYPGLNRGQWKSLEDHTRKLAENWDTIRIEAGCVGEERKVNRLSVPTHCWKIIEIVETGEITAYVFPNVPEKTRSFVDHIVSLDSIDALRR